MVSFEIFVKSMPPSLLELKVLPSFCFAFKIPDDVTATKLLNKKHDIFLSSLKSKMWNLKRPRCTRRGSKACAIYFHFGKEVRNWAISKLFGFWGETTRIFYYFQLRFHFPWEKFLRLQHRFLESWNWLITFIPATVWQILNMKCVQWPETEIVWICWKQFGKKTREITNRP